MKQFKIEVLKTNCVNSYKWGQDPELFVDNGVIFSFQSSDLNLIRERLEDVTVVKLDQCELYENQLEYQCLEDLDGNKPTKHQLELWKDDKITLYGCNYSIYLTEIIENELSADLLKGEK